MVISQSTVLLYITTNKNHPKLLSFKSVGRFHHHGPQGADNQMGRCLCWWLLMSLNSNNFRKTNGWTFPETPPTKQKRPGKVEKTQVMFQTLSNVTKMVSQQGWSGRPSIFAGKIWGCSEEHNFTHHHLGGGGPAVRFPWCNYRWHQGQNKS